MIGWVYVMDPPEYQAWLSGGSAKARWHRGRQLSRNSRAPTATRTTGSGRGPSLEDYTGKPSRSKVGQKITVDDQYLRESILSPQAKIVPAINRSCHFPGTGHRRPAPATNRIHQVHRKEERTAFHPQAGGPEGGTLKPYDYRSAVEKRENYITSEFGIKSWLLTVDPQAYRPAVSHRHYIFLFPGRRIRRDDPARAVDPQGDLFQSETYNKLFTMHGIIMVFFFLIPSIPPRSATSWCR